MLNWVFNNIRQNGYISALSVNIERFAPSEGGR